MRINIAGIWIDSYSFDQVIDQVIEHALARHSPEYVVTPNAQHIVTLQEDSHFQEIYQKARWVVPDGVSLLWAANFLGTPLKGRINGTDLFEKLCVAASEKDLKVFLLGGRPGASEQAKVVLQSRYPDLKVAGTYCPPYGFETDTIELERINNTINQAKPDILFVGLGAPKQEKWIYASYQALQVPVSLGIGVSFELVSNIVPRAPLLLQKIGCEWLFRLVMEPRRLWQRYVYSNPLFIWLVLKQKLGIK
jgi:N-acetylglucosaminyldiphosphoundecaprenol N-acetyl-beta-D-mannosaminyltransferase